MSPKVPEKISAFCQGSVARLHWLARLPEVLSDLQQRWSLTLGNPFDGDEVSCSWVAPARREDQTMAILKLGIPHMEGEDEIKGLHFWAGNPTVKMLEWDDDLGAMLLERCEPGTCLRELPEPEQDKVIAALLRRLWRLPSPADHFRPLTTMTAYWRSETLARSKHWKDPGLVAEGLQLMTSLAESASTQVLLATDLHAGNVLRAEREPWLVIDPKPFLGDPAYDATQHLLNSYRRLLSSPDNTIRGFSDLLNVDHERVRLWTFARAAAQAGDECSDDRWIELARVIGN